MCTNDNDTDTQCEVVHLYWGAKTDACILKERISSLLIENNTVSQDAGLHLIEEWQIDNSFIA